MPKEPIQFIFPQFERSKGVLINEPPKTADEFYRIIKECEWADLKQFGFRKWDTINNVVKENLEEQGKPTSFKKQAHEFI